MMGPPEGRHRGTYISDGARQRLVSFFDQEILDAHKKDQEELRQALCRIKEAALQC